MFPGDLICLGFCDNTHLPSVDVDHAFEPTFNVSDGSLLINDGQGHLVKFFSLSPALIPDNKFYGFTNENGIIIPHKLKQSKVAIETASGITLNVTEIDPVSEAYLYTLGHDITVGRCDGQGNILTEEWIYRKGGITLPVRFHVIPTVGAQNVPVGLHTADIGAASVTTQNGEDFTLTLTLNDGSTLTAAWSGIKWRSYEPDLHTDWTDPLNPVLMLNNQIKQDVQRSINNVEIEQTLDLATSLLTTTLTLYPNLGTPFTRTKVVDLSDLRIRWGNIIGMITNQADLVDYITQRLLPYELLANKTQTVSGGSTGDEYPSAQAVWEHSVPRADVPTLLTELVPGLVSAHELSFTKSWYDTPNRASDSETKSLTSDDHLLFSSTSGGHNIAVDMPSLVSQAFPNWLGVDATDGNLRVDVTYDLSLKEDEANKADSIDDTNKDDAAAYPSNKAITEWSDARYIHTAAGTAPNNPQSVGTALDIDGAITVNGVSGGRFS